MTRIRVSIRLVFNFLSFFTVFSTCFFMPSKFLFILSHLLSANTSDIATVDIIIVRALVPLQPLPQIWFYSFQLFLMVRSKRVITCLFLISQRRIEINIVGLKCQINPWLAVDIFLKLDLATDSEIPHINRSR